jgi:autotransporter-associated beta strand protein
MKPRILSTARLSIPLASAIAALLAVESVSATTYYWDNNGATAGFGSATGTWAAPTTGDATQGWSTSSTGALLPGNITTANTNATTDALNFGNTTTGLAAGTINVSGTVNAGAITFAAGSVASPSGPITLSGGTISLFGSATPLTINSSGHTIGSALTLNGVSTFTFTASAASSVNLNGAIGGTGGLNIASAGSQTATYNLGAANNYSGDTSITTVGTTSSTFVILGVADALPTGTVLTMAGQNGAGTGRTVRLDLNGHNQTLAGLTNITGKTLRNQQVTNTGALATLTVNNSSNFSYGGTVNGSTVTTSTISGAIALIKQGAGTLTLSGAANSYTGATKISGGILSLGHIQSLQNSALDTLGSIAGDETNGLRATVTSLSLAGLAGNKDLASVFTTTTGGYTGSLTSLTFNPGTGVNLSYSGAIADGATGMTLTKSGLGTQVLSGANTFSGNTTLNAGKLTGVVGGSFANSTVVLNSATATSNVSITDNTKSWTDANLTTAAAGTLEFDFGSVTPSATVAPLVVTGDATFTETPGVSIVGSNLAVGTFPLMTWTNTSGSAPTVASMPPGFSGSLSISGNTLYLEITTPTFKADNANDLNNPLSWTNGVPSPSQSAIWDNTVAAANTCDLGGDLTWAGISILNPGGLVTINGSNTLTLGAAAKDIDLSTATADLTVNTALAMGAANVWDVATGRTLTLSNVVSGSFPVTKQGPGTVVLSGVNTYDAQTTLTEGTLSVSEEDNLGDLLAPLILNGGILRITGTTMTSLARSLNFTSGKKVTLDIADVGNTFRVTQNLTQGSGGFTKLGAGTAVLSGFDTFTGMLTVNAGTLNLTTNRTAGTLPPVTVSGSSAVLGFGANYNLGTQTLSVSSGGTVNHTAGSVTSTSSGSAIGVDTGIYNLSGGSLSITNPISATRGLILGEFNGATATFNLSGTGALTMSTNSTLQIGRSQAGAVATGTTGNFNQSGGTASIQILRMGGNSATENANTTANLNLSSGTFTTSAFSALSVGDNSTSSIAISGTADVTLPAFPTARGSGSTATVTFDGGTLRPGAASGSYMGGLTSAFIKAGGATIAPASGRNITIAQNLLTDAVSLNGGLTKDNVGVLTLTGANTYTGATTVSAGTLLVISPGSLNAASAVAVNDGTLGGTGTIGGNVTVAAAGNLAPGASAGTLTIGGALDISAQVAGTGKLVFELGTLAASDKIAAGTVNIGSGVLGFSDFTFTNLGGLQVGTYQLITSGGLTGSLDPANLTGMIGAFKATLQLSGTGTDVELVVSSAYASWAALNGLDDSDAAHFSAKAADPDGDGHNNLYEFAFDGNPLSGVNDGKIVGKVATVGAAQVLTLTLPVRTGATFAADAGDQLSALIDDICYRIEGDVNLSSFADAITEVTTGDETGIQLGLPTLSTGWTYRTFRAPDTVPTAAKAFLRAKVSETP